MSGNNTTGDALDVQSTLCSNGPVAGDEAGQVGRWEPEVFGEALLSTTGELLEVAGEVHRNLPSGSFDQKFTNSLYQVKVISQLGNYGFNGGMDIRETRRLRLRQLIDEKFNGVDAAFAAQVDKSPSYIARLFTDKEVHRRNISETMARTLEKLCGIEEGWLDQAREGDQPDQRPPSYELEPIEVWDDETPLDDEDVEIPYLKEVEIAAGGGKTAVQPSGKRKLRFGKYTIRNQGVDPANAVCATVSGNSMEPVLRNGTTVGIDRGATRIIDGDMYAIDHEGQLRIKQLYRLPGGGMRLRSFNRDEHADEDYSPQQVQEHIVVIGRVWWGATFF